MRKLHLGHVIDIWKKYGIEQNINLLVLSEIIGLVNG